MLIYDLVLFFKVESILRALGQMEIIGAIGMIELLVVVSVDAAWVGVFYKSIYYSTLALFKPD
jgi:hypothetical protein